MFFTTKQLKELSVDHAQAREQYGRVQAELVREVVGIACKHLLFITLRYEAELYLPQASYIPVMESLDDLVAHLDVIVSFAHVSANAPSSYVKPEVLERGEAPLDGDYREGSYPLSR